MPTDNCEKLANYKAKRRSKAPTKSVSNKKKKAIDKPFKLMYLYQGDVKVWQENPAIFGRYKTEDLARNVMELKKPQWKIFKFWIEDDKGNKL